MPQKKNPDVPELVRGKSGRAIGNLVTLLTVLKGLPLTYNRDLQEDKEPIFDTAAHARRLARGDGRRARDAAREHGARCARAADDPLLLATDLAEALVREGVPFREAHEAVGKIVAHCIAGARDLRTLSKRRAPGLPSGVRERRRRAALGGARARRPRADGRHGARARARGARRRGAAPRGRSRRARPARAHAVRRFAASLAFLVLGLALACGKYGPPVRASAAAEPERKPEPVLPLPLAPEGETRRSAPPERAPDPEREEEPPPEGAP